MSQAENTSPSDPAPATPAEARGRLVQALGLDLVGPGAGHPFAAERLPEWVRPSNWYLTGFLIPTGTPPEESADADEEDDFELVPEAPGLAEESTEDRRAAKKGFFPSSMGISFLLPPEVRQVEVLVRWGDYALTEIEGQNGMASSVWQRTPREERIDLRLGSKKEYTEMVPGSKGLQLQVVERTIPVEDPPLSLPKGTRSVSVFLVNHRIPEQKNPDLAYAFQAQIEVRSEKPFLGRPDMRGAIEKDWDERVADLHYADTPSYATGHGVSVEWEVQDGACRVLRTAWIPEAQVEKTVSSEVPGVELSMGRLGSLADGKAAQAALSPLVARYREWIASGEAGLERLANHRRETGEELLRHAELAADRIERGIGVLAEDALALDAFRVANRAVARALKKRLGVEDPTWRPFQLAFLLLNLPGLANPADPDRETVDLLFFPTGGGKTEAYLGLAAFAMVLRRLRHQDGQGYGGCGVSVIMRYTLRLLTLDQLSRASGLVCALELEREEKPERFGSWPFEIGLWVGKAGTPNILGSKGDGRSDSARSKVQQYQSDPRGKPLPIPLSNCPWCGTPFNQDSFVLWPDGDNPKELRIVCTNIDCEFSGDHHLPIVTVDEPLYRRLPAFLVATVDKFASLPWVGPSGVLLGGADHYDKNGFYGPAQPGKGKPLPRPVPPPDLIIQDELHLISGPLGTMAGLYETAIDALAIQEVDGKEVRPKIVASTATVRRAQDQIQALFARSKTQIFPPPGPDRRDSFFARTLPATEVPARQYLGVAAQGRNPKVLMRRVWLALMGAAERIYREAGGGRNKENPADPYMTVLGYFNSLRELGGARRILEEQIQNTLKDYGKRRRVGEHPGLFKDRKKFSEVVELTSRVSTDQVAEARRRLGKPYYEKDHVDCAIATNMISVGLDIPRLGLMVVLGQPKTNAEYIQATSRVGREEGKPGLVVTLFNIHRPRDRSHYERFRHYHETFYRSVEVGSITPFSARALDRGLAGALVGFARHAFSELTPPEGVARIQKVRSDLEERLLKVFLLRLRQQPISDKAEREELERSLQNRIVDLLDSWCKIIEDYRKDGVGVQYQRYEKRNPRPLLREVLEKEFELEDLGKFRVNRSLRDVEPEVNLFLKELNGREVGER